MLSPLSTRFYAKYQPRRNNDKSGNDISFHRAAPLRHDANGGPMLIGMGHSYTSWGGLIAGVYNASTNVGASVTGGEFNLASGLGNVAGGYAGSISGGHNMTQMAPYAWIGGLLQSTPP
jgi:hypothetical protein